MAERVFTEAHIRAAFFDQFNEAGELWFPYVHGDRERHSDDVAHCAAVTENAFQKFLAALASQEKTP